MDICNAQIDLFFYIYHFKILTNKTGRMKSIRTILIVLAAGLLSLNLQAQTFMYDGIEGQLSEAQRAEIENAQGYVEKAEKSIKSAEAIEAKYEDLMKSNKNSKRKKWEKKGWEAKKYRIDSEIKFAKGYAMTVAVYSELIESGEFYSTTDQKSAADLNAEAFSLMENSDKKLSTLKKSVNSKSDLQKTKYKQIMGDIDAVHKLMEDALEKQFTAINLLLKQADKKLYDQKDNLAWEEAKDVNTIESYQDYLSNFGAGKYVAQARQKMKDLQKAIDDAKTNEVATTTTFNGYTFKVQIAASRTPLAYSSIKRRYAEVDKVERQKVGKYYKYRVGSFNSYEEAAAFKQKLSAKGAFIVVFDKSNNQVEVTDEMKGGK